MTLPDIARNRLITQQIAEAKFATVKELVAWMGAMQAQDYAMVKWAVGTRLPGSTDKLIENAIDRGEVIRAHLMRPTWHLVSAEDIYWMLELSAPQIKASLRSRHKELELSEANIKQCNSLIIKTLIGGKHLTRDELVKEFNKAKIVTDNNRASHLLLCAELDGIICSGSIKNKLPTYALLAERVPNIKTFKRTEALAKLAQRYFLSHGPATLQDFIWWSGLSVSDTRYAMEMVKSGFNAETIGSETYWMTNSFHRFNHSQSSVNLLAAYDEYIIGYKNRSASISIKNHKKAVSSNGIFRPVIMNNGQVIGLWKRTIKNDNVIIETDFFQPHNKATMELVEKAIKAYGRFIGKETYHPVRVAP